MTSLPTQPMHSHAGASENSENDAHLQGDKGKVLPEPLKPADEVDESPMDDDKEEKKKDEKMEED